MNPCWRIKELTYHALSSKSLPVKHWKLAITETEKKIIVNQPIPNFHGNTSISDSVVLHYTYFIDKIIGNFYSSCGGMTTRGKSSRAGIARQS